AEDDPRAQRHVELAPFDLYGLLEFLLELADRLRGLAERPDVLQKHGEFVAAHPGDRPVPAVVAEGPLVFVVPLGADDTLDARPEAGSDLLEHAIAHQVSQAVVDVLEPIDVHEDDGQALGPPALAGPAEGVRQAVE